MAIVGCRSSRGGAALVLVACALGLAGCDPGSARTGVVPVLLRLPAVTGDGPMTAEERAAAQHFDAAPAGAAALDPPPASAARPPAASARVETRPAAPLRAAEPPEPAAAASTPPSQAAPPALAADEPPVGGPTDADKLRAIERLHDRGLISSAEYEDRRARLLGAGR